MGYIAGGIIIVIMLFLYFRFIRKMNKPIVNPEIPVIVKQKKTIRLKNTPPSIMKVGERFQINWEVVEIPSENLVSAIVNWRVERPESIPVGGPDLPILFVDNSGMFTAIGEIGHREIYAEFADTPGQKEISFTIDVI